MKVHGSLDASFVILPKPPPMVSARHRMETEILQHATREVTHVEHGLERQSVAGAYRILGGRARTARDVLKADCTGHIDAAVDRGDPCGTGEWIDDARGAEDRKAPHDAEPRVPGFLGEGCSSRNGDLDLGPRPEFGGHRCHHLRGTGLMAGSPTAMGRPGFVTVPRPRPP